MFIHRNGKNDGTMKFFLFIAFFLLSFSASAADYTLDKIIQKQEIRCGVYVLGSVFSYDKKGIPQGFTVDLMNEISDRTGLIVRYAEISSFATLAQDLDAGKIDMVCSPLLLLPATGMRLLPGRKISDDEINVYADGSADVSQIRTLSDLNDSRFVFAGMDGELGGLYAPKLFPKAKLRFLAPGASSAQLLKELHTKKAHFIVLSRLAAKAYLKNNPGKLQKVTQDSIVKPSLRLFYPSRSLQLKANIDAIIEDIQDSGLMKKLLIKHEIIPSP
jgi:ABC-type amino acid transport substrate-binding protein